MTELASLIYLLGIGIAVVSVLRIGVRYQQERRQARHAGEYTRKKVPPIRQLESGELSALQPLLEDPDQPGTRLVLHNWDVHLLEGPFKHDGVVIGSQVSWRDMIADLEVILPYDAPLYIKKHNRAEVIFAGHYAIVLRLNDHFDLREAFLRDRRRISWADQWQSGTPGLLELVYRERRRNDKSSPEPIHLLKQRLETPQEMKARQGHGVTPFAAIACLAAFFALIVASELEAELARQAWSLSAAALLLMGIWLFWRPQRLDQPERINRVAGPLEAYTVQAPNGKSFIQLTLGAQLEFSVPHHWFPYLDPLLGKHIEADIRVNDRTAVRLCNIFRLEDEVLLYPPRHWRPHSRLIEIATGAFIGVALLSPSLSDDLTLTRNALVGNEVQHFQDSRTLIENLPDRGNLLNLRGRAHCQTQPDEPVHAMPAITCHHLHWDEEPRDTPLARLEYYLHELAWDDFIEDREITNLDAHRMELWRYADRQARRVVTNLPHVVKRIDKACAESISIEAVDRGCNELRDQLIDSMAFHTEQKVTDWTSLKKILQGRTDHSPAMLAHINTNKLRQLRSHAERLSNHLAHSERQAMAVDPTEQQHSSLILTILNPRPGQLPLIKNYPNETDHQGSQNTLFRPADARPFQVEGILSRLETNDDGPSWLIIDAARDRDTIWPAIVRSISLIIATLIILIHGSLLAINFQAARRREEALNEHIQKRTGVSGS